MSDYKLPLSGKLAIVTGASRGIGEGIAMELAQRGANLILVYSSPSSASRTQDLATRIQALPHSPKATIVQANLATIEGPSLVVSHLQSIWAKWSTPSSSPSLVSEPKVDILINNAGSESHGPLETLTFSDYSSIFDINVRAIIFLTQALLPYLSTSPPSSSPSSSSAARIINISSVVARSSFAYLSLYSSSKAAVEGLTRSWAGELGPERGITVNCVAPGPTAGTDMADGIPGEVLEGQRMTTPLHRRLGRVEDIALAVGMLAGKESDWITGQTVAVCGGWVMY